jgi:hypothetical protein
MNPTNQIKNPPTRDSLGSESGYDSETQAATKELCISVRFLNADISFNDYDRKRHAIIYATVSVDWR